MGIKQIKKHISQKNVQQARHNNDKAYKKMCQLILEENTLGSVCAEDFLEELGPNMTAKFNTSHGESYNK